MFDRLVSRRRETSGIHLAAWLLGEMDLLLGHPEAARDRLVPVAELESESKTPFLATLAWAYLACGEQGKANLTADEAVQHARSPVQRLFLPDALRVKGMVLSQQERRQEAGSEEEPGGRQGAVGLVEDKDREGDDPHPVAELVDRIARRETPEGAPAQGVGQASSRHS